MVFIPLKQIPCIDKVGVFFIGRHKISQFNDEIGLCLIHGIHKSGKPRFRIMHQVKMDIGANADSYLIRFFTERYI
jgi:hypothetical protein